MTEVAFSASTGETPRRIITLDPQALEVTGMGTPDGPHVVLLLDGIAMIDDALDDTVRLAVGLPPAFAARLAVELHAAAAEALTHAGATGGTPGAPGG